MPSRSELVHTSATTIANNDDSNANQRAWIFCDSRPDSPTADHFADLRKHYTEDQIVELGATIALFGFLNRWNDTFATTLEPESAAFANQHLSASGWEIGKHG
jgi:hypothetical protein